MPKTLLSLVFLAISSQVYAQVWGPVLDQQGQAIANVSVIETVSVIGLPLHLSNLESAHPVNVITAEELRDQQSSSLGETLKYEVGIHSSYFSRNSAAPIIRGLDGPRVLITQNGLDASDASRVGPDHAISTETSYAQQVEVLRGPATLFYGSGAIGGVVNVVDDRIPKTADTYGEWRLENQSVADDKLMSASGNTGLGNVGLHADGFWRYTNDYKIPGPAEVEQDNAYKSHDEGHLANSWAEASGGNIGGSYLVERGFMGASIGRIERQYGIPGHSHGDELIDVYADIQQNRVQLLGKKDLDIRGFSSTNSTAGYTDYEHAEIEGSEIATRFKNKTSELRWELFHRAISDWRGALSFHYKRSDFEAIGEEAFTPPSMTETLALGFMEEKHIDSVLLQLSGRIEDVRTTANDFQADLNHPNSEERYLSLFSVDQQSTPVSFSTGAVWDFTPGYNAAISFTHAQRAPAASELFSFGPHIGSGLYEVGYLMDIKVLDKDKFYFTLNEKDIELEKSNNLDLSLRKKSGNFGFVANAFYNQIDNFYYLNNTGVRKVLEHHHDHDGEHEEEIEMPAFIYQAADVDLWGYEAEAVWKMDPAFELTVKTDSTRALVNESSHLPRIPPKRYSISGEYQKNQWRMQLTAQYYAAQNRIAELETATDSYYTLDIGVSYNFLPEIQLFLKGYNLTDEYARVHSSFLKDKAPLPARNIAAGVSGRF